MKLNNVFCFLVLNLCLLFTCFAQPPSHIGVLGNIQIESQGSGNGTIYGGEAQAVAHLKRVPVTLVANVQGTADKKIYRGQYGGAVRVRALARYRIPNDHLFVQGGIYAGGIVFPDTSPTVKDGYVKYTVQPVIGAGTNIYDRNGEVNVTLNYLYLFKRAIYAQDKPLNFQGNYIDGWTRGQRIGLESQLAINRTKWLFLLNASYGNYVYTRNAGLYGPVLGNVPHRYSVTEVSVGIGRKYGK